MPAITWKYIHLVLNPFPIVLAITGTAVGLVGWATGREGWEKWAIAALLLAGIAAPFTYYSGIAAGDVVAQRTFVKPGVIQTHRTWATWTVITVVADGVFAAFSLTQPGDSRLRRFVILVGILCSVLAGVTGFFGGRIAHGPEEERGGMGGGPASLRWAPPAADSPAHLAAPMAIAHRPSAPARGPTAPGTHA